MTGRGQSMRSGSLRSPGMPLNSFAIESPRRGRGRPRKYPLTSILQIPEEAVDRQQSDSQEYEQEEGETEERIYYDAEQEAHEEEMVEEDVTDEAEADREEVSEEDRIKIIQHAKMMIVTPLGQKRNRGRPARKPATPSQNQPSSSKTSTAVEAEVEEGAVAAEEQAGEGPSSSIASEPVKSTDEPNEAVAEKAKEPEEPKSSGRPTRTRQPTRKILELSNDFELKSLKPRKHASQITSESTAGKETEKQIEESSETNGDKNVIEENADDRIEPLLPNDAHIEDPNEVMEKVKIDATKIRGVATERVPAEVQDAPPPAPKHLLNRGHSRGRPLSVVPPHRRPVPKDLLPPGLPPHLIARRPVQSIPKDVKKIIRERVDDPKQSSSSSSSNIAVEKNDMISDSVPPPPPALSKNGESAESKVSEPRTSKKREAGQDLPYEHMPKQKARHVARAGLVPNMGYDQIKAYELPIHEGQMIMEHHVMEGDESGSQQRVILQNGEFLEEHQMDGEDMMEADNDKEMMMKAQHTRYIQVEEDGVNFVYEVQPHDVVEEVEDDERVVEEEMQIEEGQVQEEEYIIEEREIEEASDIKMAQVAMEAEIAHQEDNIEQNVNDLMEDDDDDMPPQLVPEEVQDDEVVAEVQRRNEEQMMGSQKKDPINEEEDAMNFDLNMMEPGQTFRLNSPGGRSHEVQLARDGEGNSVFIDENGVIVELITDNGTLVEPSGVIETELQQQHGEMREVEQEQIEPEQENIEEREREEEQTAAQTVEQLRNVEFNFLDSRNICCGLCGEIVLYENLVSEHLPNAHPEFLQPGVELEEVPYENWLKSRLRQDMKSMANGFRTYDEAPAEGSGFGGSTRLFSRGLRQLRKVSQIRVNPNEMSMQQLEVALKRKMIEKLGRKVAVTLIDRLHARCDICQAVVSLNKKFEVIHLVRHFNAWHPSEHRCSNAWKVPSTEMRVINGPQKNLSLHDFAVIDPDAEQNNLQCIWCGMFIDRSALGMHFSEVHGDQVSVPKCSLCLQEMVLVARLMEKYGEDFGISFPDEFHVESNRLHCKYSSEKSLDKAIERYLKKVRTGGNGLEDDDEEDREEEKKIICTTNSQQSFGRRNRLKRKFVKPCFRQICPTNSQYFLAFSACEWKCKLCGRNVYGAVISAGAIKHYKEYHPGEIENMQYELVKARLERISDGSMEFVHPQLVECLICNLTYALHKPFNICRAIRHLRLKHPEVMPETAGKPISGVDLQETTNITPRVKRRKITIGEIIADPVQLERFRREHEDTEFDKVQVIYGVKPNNEPSYILLCEGEVLDQKTAEEAAEVMIQSENNTSAPLNKEQNEEDETTGMEVVYESAESQEFGDVSGQPSSSNARRVVYRGGAEEGRSRVMNDDHYPQQIVEGDELEEETKPVAYLQSYHAHGQPEEMIAIDGNEMQEGNYEIMQEEQQFAATSDENRVHFMTEEELREAEARGELQIEYVDDNSGLVEYEGYEQQ